VQVGDPASLSLYGGGVAVSQTGSSLANSSRSGGRSAVCRYSADALTDPATNRSAAPPVWATNELIVAGGGGSAGTRVPTGDAQYGLGGDGGGTNGSAGTASYVNVSLQANGGSGGSQAAGGAGGTITSPTTTRINGSAGLRMFGGLPATYSSAYTGAAGGAGYYGGGGGAYHFSGDYPPRGGGGGGSGYIGGVLNGYLASSALPGQPPGMDIGYYARNAGAPGGPDPSPGLVIIVTVPSGL